jgi:hypothetical protein
MKPLELVESSELAKPKELRIQSATNEAFRVLTGTEPDQPDSCQAGSNGLAKPSSRSQASVVELEDHLSSVNSLRPLESTRAEPVASSEPIPGMGLNRSSDVEGDHWAEEGQFARSVHSMPDHGATSVQSKPRLDVSAIVVAVFVSFSAGVLASQLWSAANENLVRTNAAADMTALLNRERHKTVQLANELSAVRHEFDAQLQFSSEAVHEATQLKKSLETLTKQLRQESEKNAGLNLRLEPAQSLMPSCDSPDCIANGKRKTVAPDDQPSGSADKVDPELARLMARANGLISQGNISGARSVLERASEMGSAKASFMIAETYDRDILAGWKTYGTRGDAAKAREYYAKAAAGGIVEAKERLKLLTGK